MTPGKKIQGKVSFDIAKLGEVVGEGEPDAEGHYQRVTVQPATVEIEVIIRSGDDTLRHITHRIKAQRGITAHQVPIHDEFPFSL